ncbi:MAG TPA: hypothetical protein VM580_01390, partial [Labilithrix sp.]|nr:hypothetical protein [Labilithrix sp.]
VPLTWRTRAIRGTAMTLFCGFAVAACGADDAFESARSDDRLTSAPDQDCTDSSCLRQLQTAIDNLSAAKFNSIADELGDAYGVQLDAAQRSALLTWLKTVKVTEAEGRHRNLSEFDGWANVGHLAGSLVLGILGAAVVVASGGTTLPAALVGVVLFGGSTTVAEAAHGLSVPEQKEIAQHLVGQARDTYIVRHGATKNGETLTEEGKAALRNAWLTVPCPSRRTAFELNYLSAETADPKGTTRYFETRDVIMAALNEHCPDSYVYDRPIEVTHLSQFTDEQVQSIFDKISKPRPSRTRIFILGSFILHRLTETNGKFFKNVRPFIDVWERSQPYFACTHDLSQVSNMALGREFMYNFIYRFNNGPVQCADTLPIEYTPDLPSNSYCGNNVDFKASFDNSIRPCVIDCNADDAVFDDVAKSCRPREQGDCPPHRPVLVNGACEPRELADCADVACAPGTVCQMKDGEPSCVSQLTPIPIPFSCANVRCSPGTVCQIKNGKPACVPQLTTPIPIPNPFSCANILCSPGTVCQIKNGKPACEPQLTTPIPIPNPFSCANVRCSPGTFCQMKDGKPVCVSG